MFKLFVVLLCFCVIQYLIMGDLTSKPADLSVNLIISQRCSLGKSLGEESPLSNNANVN